jgi:GT2 family glycosyltransferase
VVVIVLNWNGKDDTFACLRSLQRLGYGNFRVVVVDNGSEDGSESALRELFPELDILQTGANLGFAGGNNEGLRWALEHGADYALVLNNDTEVEAGLLDALVDRAESDPDIGIVGASIAYADRSDVLWAFGGGRFDVATGRVRHVQRAVDETTLASRGHVHFYVTGCTMLLRRRLLDEVGMFDTSYFHFCEDVDLCLRAEAAGFAVAVAPKARLVHKVSATTRLHSPLFLYYNLRSRLRLVQRFGPEGAPSTRALVILWLRLWRPALLSGMGWSGWRALQRALRDYRDGVEGPAPAGLSGGRGA